MRNVLFNTNWAYERRGEQGEEREEAEFKTRINRKIIKRKGKKPGEEKNIDPELILVILGGKWNGISRA